MPNPTQWREEGYEMADCREKTEQILERVDRQLAKFGLRVLTAELGGDFNTWAIVPTMEHSPEEIAKRLVAFGEKWKGQPQQVIQSALETFVRFNYEDIPEED